jgi:hypothetical protein
MRQASPICSAMPRPMASGCTLAASCSATWDWANRTDSAVCNAAVAARSFSSRAIRSIRAASRTGVVSATTATSSSKISSRRMVTGSADGGSVSGASPKADIATTLRTATDNNGTNVRVGRSQESRDPERRRPPASSRSKALQSTSRRTSPDGRACSSVRGDRRGVLAKEPQHLGGSVRTLAVSVRTHGAATEPGV